MLHKIGFLLALAASILTAVSQKETKIINHYPKISITVNDNQNK